MMTLSSLSIFGGLLCVSLGFCLATESEFDLLQAETALHLLTLYKNKTFAAEFERQFESNTKLTNNFTCPDLPPSPHIPVSVHSLRPADIKVIAALGDSLTAGRSASGTILGLLTDYRGLAWSIGGDEPVDTYKTLPNILREYNPNLYGFSTGSGTRDAKNSRLNVAKSGAESRDLPEQAEILVERLRNDPNVDMDTDWKMITLFIGGNDLCKSCRDPDVFTAEKYKANLKATLDYLQQHVPRAFVSLVIVFNIEMAKELGKGILCKAVLLYACNCVTHPIDAHAEEVIIQLRKDYQKGTRELVESGIYDTKDDFTVVLQPFFVETKLPRTPSGKVDYAYFAKDCFHYSKMGHEAGAKALWNNLLEPVGSKRQDWTPHEPYECPTKASPYFYTSKNSRP